MQSSDIKGIENLTIKLEKRKIVSALAGSIVHEIRNPLTSIKGFFQILKSTSNHNELYYKIIEDDLSQIEHILSELFTLVKTYNEILENQNIIELIDEVKLLFKPQTDLKNIEVILVTNSKKIFLHCDSTKIKHVFINLIKNAIEAMDRGGSIFIVVYENKNNIQIQVIDQGIGISDDLINKIGEPFYSTKEKGTGISMMVCYQIIEGYGGSIHAESQIGKGTTFTIILPTSNKNGIS